MDTLTWWGTATCTFQLDGLRVLTDPVLSPAGTTFAVKAPLSGQRLRYRSLAGSAATEEQLAGADLALLSHDHHGDNLDEGGRRALRTAALTLTTRAGAERLRREGLHHVHGLAPWQSHTVEGRDGRALRITATPARHGPWGTNWIAGPVIGFVIERVTDSGGRGRGPLYLSGDTRFFSGVTEVARRLGPIELAVLHLGAARLGPKALRRWLRFSMDADDAIASVTALEPRRVVPIHFEGWSHFSMNAADARQRFADAGIAERVRWLSRGEQVPLAAL